MKETPMLFNGAEVRAILAGRKTQTRQVVKPQPPEETNVMVQCSSRETRDPVNEWWAGRRTKFPDQGIVHSASSTDNVALGVGWECHYGQVGDRIWVKETFTVAEGVIYREDWETMHDPPSLKGLWKPSIFMPRALSRITLEITGVRVERLQEIRAADAIAEGLEIYSGHKGAQYYKIPGTEIGNCDAVYAYSRLWDSINAKKAPWESNPWVFVIEFKKMGGEA